MAEFLRRIHALPMPAPARSMSPAKWIDHYCAAAGRSPAAAEGPNTAAANAAGPNAAAPLRSAAARRLAALAALPSAQSALCHSDLHTLNLIDRGGSLLLLDWEYAHASDPLWDLAGWGANNDFEEQLMHELLAGYTGRCPTDHEYSRLRLLSWLYDYVCLCWSELYLKLRHGGRPGAGDAEGVAARALGLAARLGAS
jgi:aminoglycoside phosphotransferase (APT) family kinase protein